MFLYPHTNFKEPPGDIRALYKDLSMLKDWIFWLSKRLAELARDSLEKDINIMEEIDTLTNKLNTIMATIENALSTLENADSAFNTEVYDAFSNVVNSLKGLEDEINALKKRMTSAESEIDELKNRITIAETNINLLFSLLTGSTIGTLLTYETDYTVETYNGWVFDEGYTSHPNVYFYGSNNSTIVTIAISRNSDASTRLHHPTTIDQDLVTLRHSLDIDSEDGLTSRMFCVTFLNNYAYLNDKSGFTVTPRSLWLLNGRPLDQRCSWEAEPYVVQKNGMNALDTGFTVGLASYSDGYNDQFATRYNPSSLYFHNCGNNIVLNWG